MTNVVDFNSCKPEKDANVEEHKFLQLDNEQLKEFTSYVCRTMIESLMGILKEENVDSSKHRESHFKDLALMSESVRSVVLRLFNEKHALQNTADAFFTVIKEGDTWYVADSEDVETNDNP